MTETRSRIILVDDHPIVREGLRRLLEHKAGGEMEVCAEAAGSQDALALIEQTAPDMAIVDVFLQGADGIELIKRIRCRWESLGILVLSMHDEQLYAERALQAGANGYIMKKAPSDELLKAIRTVLAGGSYVSEAVLSRIVRKLREGRGPVSSGVDVLSDRELEVFRLLGHAVTTRGVADELRVSVKTVETYLARIREKLGLRTMNEVICHAVQWVNSDTRG